MRRSLLALGLMMMTQVAMAGYNATSAHGTNLGGHWLLNASLSDNAEQMLQKRLEKDRERREAWVRRARAEGELWIPPDPDDETSGPPGPQEGSGAGPPNPPRDGLRKRRDDELRKMLGISNTLDITQSGATIGIISQVDARRFEAGVRSQVSMPQGELADSTVGWDGDWFVIERKVRSGPRVVEKYRWLKKTDQLESLLAWSGDSPLSGIKVRRIYDRTIGSIAPPDPALGPVR